VPPSRRRPHGRPYGRGHDPDVSRRPLSHHLRCLVYRRGPRADAGRGVAGPPRRALPGCTAGVPPPRPRGLAATARGHRSPPPWPWPAPWSCCEGAPICASSGRTWPVYEQTCTPRLRAWPSCQRGRTSSNAARVRRRAPRSERNRTFRGCSRPSAEKRPFPRGSRSPVTPARARPRNRKPGGRARAPSAGGQEAPSRGGASRPGARQLSLGLTQDEVRRRLGDPARIEPAGAYVFWHYSPTGDRHYVIFEQPSGQVSGWRGP
jgi:hypothetical protein